jgi:MOSC domain-containing protein YiiM
MQGVVVAVGINAAHTFSKTVVDQIHLLAGVGVEGDAHSGATVKHRSRVARGARQPNLRQVHLMHSELFGELARRGFAVTAGAMGENITTRGIDLLGLPEGAELHIGKQAVVRITGLRNPCWQLDRYQRGLMAAVLERTPDGKLIRKAGVMSVVAGGGVVRAGDAIRIALPAAPHRALVCV